MWSVVGVWRGAAAAMGTSCNALNVHATFAQLYAPDLPVRRVLAVAAGPGTPALLKELEDLAAALRPADDVDVDVEAALDAHFGARRDPARKLDRFFGDAPESDFRKRTSPFVVKKRMDPDVTGERREVRHSQNHQKKSMHYKFQ